MQIGLGKIKFFKTVSYTLSTSSKIICKYWNGLCNGNTIVLWVKESYENIGYKTLIIQFIKAKPKEIHDINH